jgi:allophanate hydrolase
LSTVHLVVAQAGPLTTIQDGGRRGLMRFGVPQSGPVDRLAFAAANAALGNPLGAPAIELSLGGLTLACRSGEVGFALTGGDFTAELDGVRSGPGRSGG